MRALVKKFKCFDGRILTIVIGLVVGSILFAVLGTQYAIKDEIQQSYRHGDLIRIHIIANSDLPEDQMLKMKVRDDVLKMVEPLIRGVKNVNEAYAIIEENLPAITAVAQKEVQEAGEEYGAVATMGNYNFPPRNYGSFALPAGEYKAVRIILGDGVGQNWWCVLFPPLCLVDVAGSYETKERAKASHTENQDESPLLLDESATEDVPLRVGFKLAEVWQRITAKHTALSR